jgi:hypothetical protein
VRPSALKEERRAAEVAQAPAEADLAARVVAERAAESPVAEVQAGREEAEDSPEVAAAVAAESVLPRVAAAALEAVGGVVVVVVSADPVAAQPQVAAEWAVLAAMAAARDLAEEPAQAEQAPRVAVRAAFSI